MDFKILLERIRPALKNISRRHVLYGFFEPDDLYQEMCLFLWSRFSEGMPVGMNEAYIKKACEFHILNYMRKGRPKAYISSIDEVVTPDGLKLEDVLADKRTSYLSSAEENVSIDDVKNMGLTENEKKVFSLLLEGNTVREAAKKLGVSHVMVLKHKKKIIEKWRKKVTKNPDNLL